MNFLAFVKLLS